MLEGFRRDTPIRDLCRREGIQPSTYYRRLERQAEARLEDKRGGSKVPWNKIRPDEEAMVLAGARASPELSLRELAWKITAQSNGGNS